MIQIITEEHDWRNVLGYFEDIDCYHTYDYHQLDKRKEDKAVLIVYKALDKSIALPLLIRPIQGSNLYDATSVYGYAGPLTKNIDNSYDNSNFVAELKAFLHKEKIVSLFSRLNPYIPFQDVCLKNIGNIDTLGGVVNIDLGRDVIDQKRQYQKRLRTQVNKAQRHCNITKVSTDEQLYKFIEIYYDTMHRIDANPKYFFSQAYFKGLLTAKDFKSEILLASDKESGSVIGGVLIIKIGKIVQYHLSGTNKDFLHLNPVKLLIDTIRIEATDEGYRYFNLGGGVGSAEDSLFRFKKGFSKDYSQFQIWKCICDNQAYAKLVQEKQKEPQPDPGGQSTAYFPLYRTFVSELSN